MNTPARYCIVVSLLWAMAAINWFSVVHWVYDKHTGSMSGLHAGTTHRPAG